MVVRKESKKMFKKISRPQNGVSFISSVPGTDEEIVLTVASGDPPFKIQTTKQHTGDGPNFTSDAVKLITTFKF